MDARVVFDDLVRFETLLWNGIDAILRRESGLSLGGLDVLKLVRATPSCRVHHVARALAITVGGASQAIDRLESRGLCVRRADPADRRSSVLELTTEGEALLRGAEQTFERELEVWLCAPLPGRAFDQLAAALAALRAAAAARSEAPAAP